MRHHFNIKRLKEDDIQEAMDLVWRVFLEFEAPDYSQQGIDTFRAFIQPDCIYRKMEDEDMNLWVCRARRQIVGVIAAGTETAHINLLFVEKAHQNRGIAKALVKEMETYYQKHTDFNEVTVNSSPYATEVYHRLGFQDLDGEQLRDGLRFTPMHKFM